jgi:protein-L-isoaspartate(D-aspartate) O-methyltransferase
MVPQGGLRRSVTAYHGARKWVAALAVVCCLALATVGPPVMAVDADGAAPSAREALWQEVDATVAQLGDELGFTTLSPRVRAALEAVPREAFVPPAQKPFAYANRPLPIGYGQTISQPLIVAIMTELLDVEAGERVFELGTGSGYQAAVLDAMGAQVFSVEIVPELGRSARAALDSTGHDDVQTRIGDGYFGWESEAPFDAIIVTAAGDHIPPPLLRQLEPGGRMVIPVGSRYAAQRLVLVTRDEDGTVRTRDITPVAFVPLTGQS